MTYGGDNIYFHILLRDFDLNRALIHNLGANSCTTQKQTIQSRTHNITRLYMISAQEARGNMYSGYFIVCQIAFPRLPE